MRTGRRRPQRCGNGQLHSTLKIVAAGDRVNLIVADRILYAEVFPYSIYMQST